MSTTSTAEARLNVRVNKRLMRRELRAANKRIRVFGDSARRTLQSIGTGAKMGIGAALALGAKSALDLNKQVWHLGRQAKWSNEQIDKLPQKFRDMSNQTGVQADQVFMLAQRYMDLTGNIDGALENAEFLAKAVAAQNAPADALAQLMWMMSESLKLSGEESRKLLDTFVAIGDEGSVPLDRMAATLPEMVAAVTKISSETGQEAGKMSAALLQVLETATAGPEKSITATKAALTAMSDNAKKLKREVGIEVFDREGNRRGVVEILQQFAKVKGLAKNNKLKELLGGTDAVIAVKHLVENIGRLKRLSAVEGKGLIEANHQKYMESAAGQMAIAAERAKNAMASAFTPEVIHKIADAAVLAADGFELLADNLVPVGIGFAALKSLSLVKLLRDLRFARTATKMLGLEAKNSGKYMGLLGGVRGSLASGTAKTVSNLSRARKLVRGLGSAVPIVGAGLMAWEVGSFLGELLAVNSEMYKFREIVQDPKTDPANIFTKEFNAHIRVANEIQRLKGELASAELVKQMNESIGVKSDEDERIAALRKQIARKEEEESDYMRRARYADDAKRVVSENSSASASEWERVVKPDFERKMRAELEGLGKGERRRLHGDRSDEDIIREIWSRVKAEARARDTSYGQAMVEREKRQERVRWEKEHGVSPGRAAERTASSAGRAPADRAPREIVNNLTIPVHINGVEVARDTRRKRSRSPR